MVGGINGETRLRSYMQLAELIPMLMVDDIESRSGRFSEVEKRRRQLALSLKKLHLLALKDPKIASVMRSIFSRSNDLDENFLKKTALPKQRTTGLKLAYEIETRNRQASEDQLFSSGHNARSPSPNQSVYVSSFLSGPPISVRMEGSVAVCTGRRSWSEEWAVLTGKFFAIPSPATSKHLRYTIYVQ
jgi:hypothetical protein